MNGQVIMHLLSRPRPPCATVRVDCCHPVSSNLTLQTVDAAMSCRTVSVLSVTGSTVSF